MNSAFIKLGDRWVCINDIVYVASNEKLFFILLRNEVTIKFEVKEGYDPADLMKQWENALSRFQSLS